jgi:hypothetical protein
VPSGEEDPGQPGQDGQRDLLDAGVPAARLTEIRRNSGLIVESCARIKDGEPFDPVRKLSDWNEQKNLVHLPARGVEAMLETLTSAYDWLNSERRWNLVDDVQVLSARNATRKRLNKDLQVRLNKDGEGTHRVFKVGDKIINLKTVTLPSPSRRVLVPLGRITSEGNGQCAGRPARSRASTTH